MRDATKFFSLLVYIGVFAFQIWVAERILVTVFRKQGREAWKRMINDASLEKMRDHFIYIKVTAKSMSPELRIITRAGHHRYAQAMRNSGADEVIIPEHEGGLMVGRMIEKYSVV